jgi:hypothetical protein
VKDIYTEKYETLLREIKHLNKWKYILSYESLELLRYSSQQMYRFNIIPVKTPTWFFLRINKLILKVKVILEDPKEFPN